MVGCPNLGVNRGADWPARRTAWGQLLWREGRAAEFLSSSPSVPGQRGRDSPRRRPTRHLWSGVVRWSVYVAGGGVLLAPAGRCACPAPLCSCSKRTPRSGVRLVLSSPWSPCSPLRQPQQTSARPPGLAVLLASLVWSLGGVIPAVRLGSSAARDVLRFSFQRASSGASDPPPLRPSPLLFIHRRQAASAPSLPPPRLLAGSRPTGLL